MVSTKRARKRALFLENRVNTRYNNSRTRVCYRFLTRGAYLLHKPKIYLDSCCFNRPFDDLSQDKVRFECEAVLEILSNCVAGMWEVFRSDVLNDEIDRIANYVKKQKVLMLYSSATIYVPLTDEIVYRAKSIQHIVNIKPFDALHLACAECSNASVLLTTDKKFINQAAAINTSVRVTNPAIWLMEVMYND